MQHDPKGSMPNNPHLEGTRSPHDIQWRARWGVRDRDVEYGEDSRLHRQESTSEREYNSVQKYDVVLGELETLKKLERQGKRNDILHRRRKTTGVHSLTNVRSDSSSRPQTACRHQCTVQFLWCPFTYWSRSRFSTFRYSSTSLRVIYELQQHGGPEPFRSLAMKMT